MGATAEEVSGQSRAMSCYPTPSSCFVQGGHVIDAPPAAVWPWLDRWESSGCAAYTYDWIENLFGLNMHSANRILPQFQDLRVGDELPLGPGRPVMRVEVCNPERVLAVRIADGNWVWIFALVPEGGRTKLISRNRSATPAESKVRVLMEQGPERSGQPPPPELVKYEWSHGADITSASTSSVVSSWPGWTVISHPSGPGMGRDRYLATWFPA